MSINIFMNTDNNSIQSQCQQNMQVISLYTHFLQINYILIFKII